MLREVATRGDTIADMRLLVGLLSLALYQVVTPTPATPTTTYHNDIMSFDFVYPSSFTPGKNADAADKADAGCTSALVGVMDMRTSFNMIFVKRYDTTCFSKELTAAGLAGGAGLGLVATDFLNDTLSQFGKPKMNSSTPVEIGNHNAAAVSGSVKTLHSTGKNVIYGATSCVISGKNIACFQFLSNECPNVAVLAASTVKFADADATAAIPARLATVCKP